MNKKILLTTIALSAISATWAYAMYGTGQWDWQRMYQWHWWGSHMHKHWCKMWIMIWHHEEMKKAFENAPVNVKAIMEKKKSGKIITDTEKQTVKDYMQKEWIKMWKYWDKRWRMWDRHEEMKKAFENAPAYVKAIMEKKKSGKTITDTEKQTVKNYMKEHRPPNMHAVKKYKDMIEKKYWAKLDAMSTEQLTNLQSKIKTLSTTVKDSTTYTEDKKRLYSEVLWALDISVKGRLQKNDASSILDSLFNK